MSAGRNARSVAGRGIEDYAEGEWRAAATNLGKVREVFVAEVLGGAAPVAGLYTRAVALALLPVLLGAFTVHWPNGWYFGSPHGGWEYIAVLLAALLVQAGLGDGRFALGAVTATPHAKGPIDDPGAARDRLAAAR
jgi:uncharacterized membrane protein YphA (DoxX/SURF4 family)